MHTSDALTQDTFTIAIDGSPATVADLLPGFDRSDRIGVVVGSPHGLVGASLLVLAGVFAFYELQRERGDGLLDLPGLLRVPRRPLARTPRRARPVAAAQGGAGRRRTGPSCSGRSTTAASPACSSRTAGPIPGRWRPRPSRAPRRDCGRRSRTRRRPGGARRRPDRRGRHDRALRRRRPAPAARPGAAAGGRGLRCRPRAYRGGAAGRARRHRRGDADPSGTRGARSSAIAGSASPEALARADAARVGVGVGRALGGDRAGRGSPGRARPPSRSGGRGRVGRPARAARRAGRRRSRRSPARARRARASRRAASASVDRDGAGDPGAQRRATRPPRPRRSRARPSRCPGVATARRRARPRATRSGTRR